MPVKVKNALFFTIKDGAFPEAKKLISDSSLAALRTRYKSTDQSTLFFAAARESGQDQEALALCRMLLERGIPVNHTDELQQTALFYAAREGHAATIRYLIQKGADPNLLDKRGETAIFYAVLKKRVDAVNALLEAGAKLEVVNNWDHTCMSIAPPELLPTLAEERTKRRRYEDFGPAPKKRRAAIEELRSWANEWPIKESVVGHQIEYKDEDIVQSADGYAVVKNPAGICAARLRVSEKSFVADHAQFFQDEPWFKELTPEDWCQTGWSCRTTSLSVLKANARALRCYSKAGFEFESSNAALWGPKQHIASEWQKWKKVHKHHFGKKAKRIQK